MTRALTSFFAALAVLFSGGAALAQPGWGGARVVATTSWVEEWDPAKREWVRVADSNVDIAPANYDTATTTVSHADGVAITETVFAAPARFIAGPARPVPGPRQYGPFRVLDNTRAAVVASTDAASLAAFAAMLAAHPGLNVIEFADAPGTTNDLANLALGRAIRAAGFATHVPNGGSARSGAVELFLAGTRRTIAPGALFAVHSWRDERGREPADFAPDAPENRLYLDYYTEMGMTADEALAFYAMTNSVPHAGARWLEGAQMARWIAPHRPAPRELRGLIEAPLRRAIARSGMALAQAMHPHWTLQPRKTATLAATLAYSELGLLNLALLDSTAAFP